MTSMQWNDTSVIRIWSYLSNIVWYRSLDNGTFLFQDLYQKKCLTVVHFFHCMGKIFCVEFQRIPFKFQTKYRANAFKDIIHILTHVSEMVDTYLLDIDCSPAEFKSEYKRTVGNRFINMWTEQVQNIHSNPILGTYCNIKCNFGMETYLDAIKNYKYRVAMSQLRTSPHTLAIEYGIYTRPKTKIEDRECSSCHILEDERHFLIECNINQAERENLFSKLTHIAPNFIHMTDEEKFIFLMCNKDQQILTWVGKFIYKSFNDRAEYLS